MELRSDGENRSVDGDHMPAQAGHRVHRLHPTAGEAVAWVTNKEHRRLTHFSKLGPESTKF